MKVSKPQVSVDVRKRPVNLTLSEDLVVRARGMTENLSGVVEELLSEFVAREQRKRLERSKAIDATIALWNTFGETHGSIADEYSTL